MNLKNVASDLAVAITGNTLSSIALVTGRNLFAAPPSLLPSAAVFLTNSGGRVEPYIGGRAALVFGEVEVMVYGVAGQPGFIQGEALALAVMGFLQQLPVSGYVSVVCLDGTPNYAAAGADGRPQWNFRVQATYSI